MTDFGFYIDYEWTGLKQAMNRLENIYAGIQMAPMSAEQQMLLQAYQMVMSYIHVDTGTLRLAQRMRSSNSKEGEIYTDASAINPLSRMSAAEYVGYEFGRGGDHDTYNFVVTQFGGKITDAGILAFRNMGVPI